MPDSSLILAYGQNFPEDSAEACIIRSTDNGKTWDKPVRVAGEEVDWDGEKIRPSYTEGYGNPATTLVGDVLVPIGVRKGGGGWHGTKAAAFVRSTDNASVLLANLNKGDFIGQIPFFSIGHEPHSASVFASKDFEASMLPLDRVLKEYNKLSSALKNIIENVSTCVLVSTRVACDFKKQTAKK